MKKALPPEVAELIRKGGVGVMPTDTIYGVVGSALRRAVVERLYALRKRDRGKPMIVLVGGWKDLGTFGVVPDARTKRILKKIWPGPVSVIMEQNPRSRAAKRKFFYLHRGTGAIAFRMPGDARMRAFLKRTGPLVAPSANPQGKPPATTIARARRYFGDRVDFYVDMGMMASKPSVLIAIRNGEPVVLRGKAPRGL